MSYIEAIKRAIDYIESHLDSPVLIDDIAVAARYSKYHFQRLFSIVTGETVGNYIRKRRLAEAAEKLAKSNIPIIEIALMYQFNSQEAFSRSFKDFSGMTPGQWRKSKPSGLKPFHKELQLRSTTSVAFQISSEPVFVEKDCLPLVGFSVFGNRQDDIIASWVHLENQYDRVARIVDPGDRFGLVYYDVHFTKSGEFHYLAAYQCLLDSVDQISAIPVEYTIRVLPAARYAVFSLNGPPESIPLSYEYIYGQWLPGADLTPVSPFDFEFYEQKYIRGDEKYQTLKIFVPIELL